MSQAQIKVLLIQLRSAHRTIYATFIVRTLDWLGAILENLNTFRFFLS